MVTDGVMDALPVGEQIYTPGDDHQRHCHQQSEGVGTSSLQQVLSWTEEPEDDMTVLAVGIWKA